MRREKVSVISFKEAVKPFGIEIDEQAQETERDESSSIPDNAITFPTDSLPATSLGRDLEFLSWYPTKFKGSDGEKYSLLDAVLQLEAEDKGVPKKIELGHDAIQLMLAPAIHEYYMKERARNKWFSTDNFLDKLRRIKAQLTSEHIQFAIDVAIDMIGGNDVLPGY